MHSDQPCADMGTSKHKTDTDTRFPFQTYCKRRLFIIYMTIQYAKYTKLKARYQRAATQLTLPILRGIKGCKIEFIDTSLGGM